MPTYREKKRYLLRILDDYLEGNPAPHLSALKFKEAIKKGSPTDFEDSRWEFLGEINTKDSLGIKEPPVHQLKYGESQRVLFKGNGTVIGDATIQVVETSQLLESFL